MLTRIPLTAATAQLIALLHKIPPPRLVTSQPHDDGEYEAVARTSISSSRIDDDGENLAIDAQEMGSRGWYALGWSFVASAGLTVSDGVMTPYSHAHLKTPSPAPQLLVSRDICNPTV